MKKIKIFLSGLTLLLVAGCSDFISNNRDVEFKDFLYFEGEVTISPEGPVEVTTVLTAMYNGPEVGRVALTFQWYKVEGENTVAIEDETGEIFIPGSAGLYHVSINGEGYHSKMNEEPVEVITATLQTFEGSMMISPAGNVKLGHELTAVYFCLDDDENFVDCNVDIDDIIGGVTYRWYRNGSLVHIDASDKYTPNMVGEHTVTIIAEGFNESEHSEMVFVYDGTLIDFAGEVTISPNLQNIPIGTELTVEYDGHETVTLTFQWFKDGEEIIDAIYNSFIPDAAGSYTVSISAPGYNSKTSDAVMVSDAPPDRTFEGSLTISPNVGVEVGDELTVSYDGGDIDGVEVNYQWYRYGVLVIITDSDKYTPDVFGLYTVRITATGFNDSELSEAVYVRDDNLNDLLGELTISPNTADIPTGTELTAGYDGPELVSFLYQWYLDGEEIENAVYPSFTPTEAGVYTVRISAEDFNDLISAGVTVVEVEI